MTDFSSPTAGTGLFAGSTARAFVSTLLVADRAAASQQITKALRSVLEAGEDLDAAEAEGGLVAVAVLAAEQRPSVLDTAPTQVELRERLFIMDTELTPARRVAARGVITRVLLPQANSWLAARSADPDWQQVLTYIEDLSEVLADE